MNHYFLDTNIILDFLANRQPFGKYAYAIFERSVISDKGWNLWTSSNSITTTYYILEKSLGNIEAKEKIKILLQYISVQVITKENFQVALTSKFVDLEDAVQYFCALSNDKIRGIVTRNVKDFKHSQLPVYPPEEVLSL